MALQEAEVGAVGVALELGVPRVRRRGRQLRSWDAEWQRPTVDCWKTQRRLKRCRSHYAPDGVSSQPALSANVW